MASQYATFTDPTTNNALLTGIESASFRFRPGTTPSSGVVVCRNVIPPSSIGNLSMVYAKESSDPSTSPPSATITFPDCLIVSASAISDQPHLMKVELLDRRWRWLYGHLDGLYNVPKPGGGYDYEKSPAQLMAFCLDAMGEQFYNLTAVSNSDRAAARPTVDWRGDVPAQALESLCRELGFVVTIQSNNRVSVVLKNVGTPPPTSTGSGVEQNEHALGVAFSAGHPPSVVRIACSNIQYQCRLACSMVGLELDGSIRPIDSLSYRPKTASATATPAIPTSFTNNDSDFGVENQSITIYHQGGGNWDNSAPSATGITCRCRAAENYSFSTATVNIHSAVVLNESGTPRAWTPEDIVSDFVSIPEEDETIVNGVPVRHRQLAQSCVGSWFKVAYPADGPYDYAPAGYVTFDTVSDVNAAIDNVDMLLPLKPYLNEEEYDTEGARRRKRYRVVGTFRKGSQSLENYTGVWRGGDSLDTERGIAKLSAPAIKNGSVSDESAEPEFADVYVECVVEVDDPELNTKQYYAWSSNNLIIGYGIRTIDHPEIEYKVTDLYEEDFETYTSSVDNSAEVDEEAAYYALSEFKQYGVSGGFHVTYEGLRVYNLDGMVRAIDWGLSSDIPARTAIAYGVDPADEPQSYEQLQEEVVRLALYRHMRRRDKSFEVLEPIKIKV